MACLVDNAEIEGTIKQVACMGRRTMMTNKSLSQSLFTDSHEKVLVSA